MKGVYKLTVSGIDGNGYQYISGMLEPERLDSNVERAKSQYRQYESVGNDLLMGFYRGVVYAREQSVLMLERLVQDG